MRPQGERAGQARLNQLKASDTRGSSWVSAHAGSGKTTVLAQRVVRLLVRGVPPGRILCLTFTRLAAANMAERVFATLSQWTRLGDADLAAALQEIGEPPKGPAVADALAAARRLFARAIDTPGGLKIQTIHAFCERALRTFPFEAGVPANFVVLEDADAEGLLAGAIDEALGGRGGDADLWDAVASIADDLNADRLAAGVKRLLKERALFDAYPDAAAFEAELRRRLGLGRSESAASIEAAILGGAEEARRRKRWIAALRIGKKTDVALAERLAAVETAEHAPAAAEALLGAFLKDDGERHGGGADKEVGTQEIAAAVRAELTSERERLYALCVRRRDLEVVRRTQALFTVARAAARRFVAAKGRAGALDYDDMIASTRALLSSDGARWVLYKLDASIDHVLVDEAQDTSADQWAIVEALTDDWLSGREKANTLFAVGDFKQSIFGFNGARPELLDVKRRAFARRHGAVERRFESVELAVSFRSAPAILSAVDAVMNTFSVAFRMAGSAAGETDDRRLEHLAAWTSPPGRVELWPALPFQKPTPSDDWAASPAAVETPPLKLARRIARLIRAWLDPQSRERITDPKTREVRPIRAGDVMILVRKRSGFFEAMNRALKLEDVPAAGADRLALDRAVAATDLVALGRLLLTPEDDLACAVVLKSPLFGLDDDALIALAPHRAGTLWRALAASASAPHRAVAATLQRWAAQARDRSPFEFFVHLLGAEGGRRAFVGRLGAEANDVLDEFLALALETERLAPPSLQAFLDAAADATQSIKRDFDSAGDAVRVMTVHAAKGLEAPIVFLPDTGAGEDDGDKATAGPRLLTPPVREEGEKPLFVWPLSKGTQGDALARLERDAANDRHGEHRRLLYVAMTRAAERLIVCGFEGLKGPRPGSWHDLVGVGLRKELADAPAPWGEGETILAMGTAQRTDAPASAKPTLQEAPPGWLLRPAPAETAPRRARASGRETTAGENARSAGRYFHFLVDRLAALPASAREDASKKMGSASFRLDERAAERLRAEALRTLASPSLAPFFGANALSEVALATARPGGVDARVDRLVVHDDEVWIADFKLGAAPPSPPQAYVRQVAVYRSAVRTMFPLRRVRGFLIWSQNAEPIEIQEETLDAAVAAEAAGPAP